MWPKHPASVVIDSATYLLTISSPDIDNIATNLYDIIFIFVHNINDRFYFFLLLLLAVCHFLFRLLSRAEEDYRLSGHFLWYDYQHVSFLL